MKSMAPSAVSTGFNRIAALFLALILVLLVVYSPALKGELLWDDDAHVTKPELRGVDGLARIWFDLGATQQYYPVTHSVFWLEQRLWGDATTGYHVVNVLLHAVSTLLLGLVLRRLGIPGAPLAAAIYALHPVCVETVAWISELKNTLSTALYLAAALAYLVFDTTRKRRWHAVALGCFLLAMLSKSVTAVFPAALLVVLWWRHGAVSWRRDVAPLLPFFVAGVVGGLLTIWVEHELVGAQGTDFMLSIPQRLFLAGRIAWFYLGTLIWPADLVFTYPRWNLDAPPWWHFAFLPGMMALLAITWSLRDRSRGPLAAALLFLGTLVPVLGFFNVYPFVFSFVADHFQYLASQAVIAFGAAGMVLAGRHLPSRGRPVFWCGCGLLLVMLGASSWRQSRSYRTPEILYQSILERNPGSWMAHDNLSVHYRGRGRLPEAVEHARASIALKPENTDAHNNLGAALATIGDIAAAKTEFVEAVRLEPRSTEARANLGRVLHLEGRDVEAVAELRLALRMADINPQVHFTLGQALARTGDLRSAMDHYRRALEQYPRWELPLRELLTMARNATDPSVRHGALELHRRHASP